MDTLTVSVSFIAVADVRPTSERHGRCRQREASCCLERSSIGVCSHAPRAVVHQRFVEVAENSVDAKS